MLCTSIFHRGDLTLCNHSLLQLVEVMACCMLAPSHHPHQCWLIVYWTLIDTLQDNCNINSIILMKKKAFENAVCKMSAILLNLRLYDIIHVTIIPRFPVPFYPFLRCTWRLVRHKQFTWIICKIYSIRNSQECYVKFMWTLYAIPFFSVW